MVSSLLSISTSGQRGLEQRNIIRNQTVMNEVMEGGTGDKEGEKKRERERPETRERDVLHV